MSFNGEILKTMNIEICMAKPCQEKNLMKMFAWMEICGDIGHSTNFDVIFDGDGSAKIKCNFETKEFREEYNKIKKEILNIYNNGKDPKYFEFGV